MTKINYFQCVHFFSTFQHIHTHLKMYDLWRSSQLALLTDIKRHRMLWNSNLNYFTFIPSVQGHKPWDLKITVICVGPWKNNFSSWCLGVLLKWLIFLWMFIFFSVKRWWIQKNFHFHLLHTRNWLVYKLNFEYVNAVKMIGYVSIVL